MNTSAGASPINDILLAGKMTYTARSPLFTATSLPGHLLHFVLSGRVRQQCNGRVYNLEPGKVLWYHEDEWVDGEVLELPWEFYSINFIAPSLAPPPEAERLATPSSPDVEKHFAAVVAAWRNDTRTAQTRSFRLHAALLSLLDLLLSSQSETPSNPIAAGGSLWWEIETRARIDLSRPVDLRQLEEWSHCSGATIARASQAAVGESPMRRLKRIRLNFARGLVQRSALTFSEIAARIGYPRIHEFSRDYKRSFGVTPSEDRRNF